jgi:hypothetical protein
MKLRLIVRIWRRIMKGLIATVALAVVIAVPASARPNEHFRARGLYQEQQPLVQMYGAGHYRQRPYQQDINPDFQLGANRY